MESVLADLPEPPSAAIPTSGGGPGLGVFTETGLAESTQQVGKASSPHVSYSQTQSQPALPGGTSLSVAELLGLGSAGPPVRVPAQVPERSEAPAAPEEAFQRPEQLAGHLGGLSALQGQAAVAAMHVSRWQEAMNIAAARGDRATYEAAARARYEAAMYHQALQHASFEALYAEAGRLEGFSSPGIEAPAQAAGASGRTHWTGMGTEDGQVESALAAMAQRRGGDAGDRAGPMDKAMLGGREDGLELLQSMLPHTRINIAPGQGVSQSGGAAPSTPGIRPGLARAPYSVPPNGNPYGLGPAPELAADMRNAALGAINPLHRGLHPELAALAASATKPSAAHAAGGWAPSLRHAGHAACLSTADELQGLQPRPGPIDPRLSSQLPPGATNAGFGAAGEGCSGYRNQKGGQDRHKGKGRYKAGVPVDGCLAVFASSVLS